MPNVKISQLPVLTNVVTSSVLPVVQSGTTYQASVSDIVNFDAVPEDILPLFSGVYDLGSTTKKWYDLYLTNALYLGSSSISVDIDNDLIFNTNIVVQGSVSATSGDFGNIVITDDTITHLGNGYNCLTIDAACVDFTGDANIAGDLEVTGNIIINGSPLSSSPYTTTGFSNTSIIPSNPPSSVSCANTIGSTSCYSVISGGIRNTIGTSSECSVISGGNNNIICQQNALSTIGGGNENTIFEQSGGSTIAGGLCNYIEPNSTQAFIGGGFQNSVRCFSSRSSVVGGVNNAIGQSSSISFIGGGSGNFISGQYSGIVSGVSLQNIGDYTFMGSGICNQINSGNYSAVVGGCCNIVQVGCSAVLGGSSNCISSLSGFSSILGGCCNTVSGVDSSILGGRSNTTSCSKSFIIGDSITADRDCATFVNNLSIKNIPTSSAGLPAGSVWNNGGVLNIV